jgi:hypothetical protein
MDVVQFNLQNENKMLKKKKKSAYKNGGTYRNMGLTY